MTGALARTIRRARDPGPVAEQCDLCATELPVGHRHVLDTRRREIGCVCQACALLFDRDAASDGHFRLVPRRRVRLPEVPTHGLGVPVGLAFFVRTEGDTVEAHYPSPAGLTQWEVDPAAWRVVVDSCPSLSDLAPEVEALLVNTAQGRRERWLVPIDDCFALGSVVRREWRGMSGGTRVWQEIDRFFAAMETRLGRPALNAAYPTRPGSTRPGPVARPAS